MKSRITPRLAIPFVVFVAAVGCWSGPSGVARAADDIDTKFDARLETYPTERNAPIKESGTTLVWLIGSVVGIIGLGGLFMDAKRSHGED